MKTASHSLLSLLILLVTIGLTTDANAQQSDSEEEFRRFSVSVQGGITLKNDHSGLQFFRSDLNRSTLRTSNFGGALEYALKPYWTTGLMYGYNTLEGDQDPFDTTIHSIGIKNHFNLNRLYAHHRMVDLINPYLTFAFGYDFFDYESPNVQFDESESFLNFGVGVGFFLTESLEFFTQMDYHIGSNQFDNKRENYYRSLLTKPSAGIRIHFGREGTQRLSSAPPRHRVPVSIQEDLEQARQQLRDAEQRADRYRDETERLERQKEEQQQEYEARIRDLEDCCRELDELRQQLAEAELEGVLAGVNFEFDSSTLLPDAMPILDNAIELLHAHPGVRIEIEGHTCNIGTADYNLGLSERRAESVKQYLIDQGIDENRIQAVGYGESQPVASNDTATGRTMNRRVAIVVLD